MKDYASMSDFEINKEVSMALLDKSANPSARYVAIGDYCNNPADAWPIVTENRISIVALEGVWGARSCDCIDRVIDASALRAAMIVFLMMKEGE